MTLRTRLLLGTALVAIVLVAAAVIVTTTTEAHLVRQVDDQLRAAELPRRFEPGGPGPGQGAPDGDDFSSLFVAAVLPDGEIRTLATPNLAGTEVALPTVPVDRVLAVTDREGDLFSVGSTAPGSRYRVLARPDRRSGVLLVFALPLDDVDAAIDRLVQLEVVATLLILAALGLMSFWVLRLGVRPIKQMTATATAIAGGDLSHRVPEVARGTEAGDLGIALNTMLGRIEEAFDQRRRSEERLRQFVGDASHELRTPVTTIRGYAELFRTGGLDDRSDLTEAMRRTEQEAVRMGSLIEDLLVLARLDQGRPLDVGPVHLEALAHDAVRDARAVHPDRRIDAELDGPAVVHGDESRLRQVVANVLTNALVHTPPEAAVHVRVVRTDDTAVVEVRDEGPGMAPEVAEQIFERFYRADPSRSRHRGGSGLGLSIARAIVDAHGGAISVETAPGQGTTLRLSVPVAGAPAPPPERSR